MANVYDLFNEFLDQFIISKKSFIKVLHDKILTTNMVESAIEAFIKNYNEEKDRDFMDKSKEQFNKTDQYTKLIFAHALWLWSFAVGDITLRTKKGQIKEFLGITDLEDKFFTEDTILSAGQYHKTNKYHEIKFIIALFEYLFSTNCASITECKNSIIEYIIKDRENSDELKYPSEKAIATQNILLHLSDPENYVPIANYSHKKSITEVFSKLIESEDKSGLTVDKQIYLIKQELLKYLSVKKKQILKEDFSWYDDPIGTFWNFKGIGSNTSFSELEALKYKKQIILYGPPGTSKTYNANQLAKILIRQECIKQKNISDVFLMNFEKEYKKRILNLQLHPNYSYEDFIVGMKIEENKTKWEKGYLLKKIDEISNNKEDNLPYVIILDEINRIDLSRLFGELFSAIENRDEAVALSAIDKDDPEFEKFCQLRVPENLYFIGTMNKIDFSLERIDFALR